MLWHYRWILGATDRIAKHFQPTFFARMSQHYSRYRPDATVPESRGEALKLHLIATDNWPAFNAMRSAQRAGAAVDRGRRRTAAAAHSLAGRARRLLGLAYYHWQRTMSVEPDLAVYSAYWDRGYACSPAAVYETARKLVPEVRGVWIVNRDAEATMPPGVPYVLKGSMPYYRLLGRARYLVNNVNFPHFLVKRPGTVHLQTHHGTPLKTMGMQHYEHPIGARGADLPKMLKRCDRWDFSVSTSPFNTAVWQRAYPCRHETLEVGYPRNDRLCTATAEDVAAAREALGIGPDERTILYVPTHREYQPRFEPPLDVERLADTLGEGNRILARVHYFHDSAFGRFADVHPRVLDVSEHPRIEDLYLAADVLVTDYSSAMFDYAILDRPIVIFAPDWEAYRDARGVNFDLMAVPPGLVARTQAELVEAFNNKTIDGTDARNARAEFRRRFCPHRDGRASELVVRRVFLAEPKSAAGRAGAPEGPGDDRWQQVDRQSPGRAAAPLGGWSGRG
jgi:CDP-glycerol glycerophosphotransferase